MRFEGNFSPEAQRSKRYCLKEMPFDVSLDLQGNLAAAAYKKRHPDNVSASRNEVMLWWIMKGFAKAYGDYIPESEKEIDVTDELDREEILTELEKIVTVH